MEGCLVLDLVPDDVDGAVDQAVEVSQLPAIARLAGEILQVPDDPRHALQAFVGLIDQLGRVRGQEGDLQLLRQTLQLLAPGIVPDEGEGPFVGLEHPEGLAGVFLHLTQVGGDEPDGVVDLVGDPRGQLADRRHLLGLDELILGLPQLGEGDLQLEVGALLALPGPVPLGDVHEGEGGPVRFAADVLEPLEMHFEADGSLPSGVSGFQDALPVSGVEEVPDLLLQEGGGFRSAVRLVVMGPGIPAAAQQMGPGWIHVEEHPVPVDQEGGGIQALEEVEEQILLDGQLPVGGRQFPHLPLRVRPRPLGAEGDLDAVEEPVGQGGDGAVLLEIPLFPQEVLVGLAVVLEQPQEHGQVDSPGAVALGFADPEAAGGVAEIVGVRVELAFPWGVGGRKQGVVEPQEGHPPCFREGRGIPGELLALGVVEQPAQQPVHLLAEEEPETFAVRLGQGHGGLSGGLVVEPPDSLSES